MQFGPLAVASSCTPTVVGHESMTLGCGATIQNMGQEAVFVAAVAASPDGGASVHYDYLLIPGAQVALPSPPAGSTWAVAYATAREVDHAADWALTSVVGVGILAGIGAADLIVGIVRGARRVLHGRY
jgi:hypothetical protein